MPTKIKNVIVLGGTSGNAGNGGNSTGGGVVVNPDPVGATNNYSTGIQPPCKLKEDWEPCGWSVAGISRLFLAERSEIDEYYFFAQNDRDRISHIQPVNGNGRVSWYKWKAERGEAKFTESKIDTKSGPAFVQKIDLPFGPISFEGRRRLRPVVRVGYVLLFEDNNGRWWLAGESEGMVTGERTTTTGTTSTENYYGLVFEALELHPIREVSFQFVKAYVLDPPTVVGQTGGGQIGGISLTVKDFQNYSIQDFI